VVAEGTPEEVAAHPDSYTGQFLRPLLADNPAKQPPKRRRRPAQTTAAPTRRTARRSA
jgi:excinuclease ABC subunit A